MEISLSEQGFNEKPKIPGIQYEKLNVNSKDLEAYIRKGHVLSANFNAKYPITQRDRTLSNFKSIQYVMIDMDDDIDCELEVLIDSLSLIPTIAYSTFSHGIKGSRYRLLYLFDKPITTIEKYKTLYSFICRECNLNLKDDCGSNPVQACIGSKEDCEYIFSDIIYNLNDLIEEDKEYKDLINSNFEISGQTDCILKEERESNIQSYCPVDISKDEELELYNRIFLNDFFNLSFKDTLDKYRDKYEYLDKTPLPITDADSPTITLPENYVEIRRFKYREAILDSFGKPKSYIYRVRKIRNGEGRKRKIYTATLLRKVMRPGISFPHLLYCALYDLYHYCFNVDEPITKKQLFYVALNAARKQPNESLIKRSRPRKKLVANPVYCEKHNVSKSKAVGIGKHLKKEKKYEEIGNLLDLNLTYEENQELMQQFGLEVSIKDIQRFRKEYRLPPLPRKKRKTTTSATTKSVQPKSAIEKSIDIKSSATSGEEVTVMITHDSGKLLLEEARKVIRKARELQLESLAVSSIRLFPEAV